MEFLHVTELPAKVEADLLAFCVFGEPSKDAHFKAVNAAMTERVLFVTGDVAGTEAERFLEETGCRWLAKPFRLKDLLRVAQEILGSGRLTP